MNVKLKKPYKADHQKQDGIGDAAPHLHFISDANTTFDMKRVKTIESQFWYKENSEVLFVIEYQLKNAPNGQRTQTWRHTLSELDINGVRMAKAWLKNSH